MTITETLLWIIAAELGFLSLLAGTTYLLFAFTMIKDLISPPKRQDMPLLFRLPDHLHPETDPNGSKPEGAPNTPEMPGQYI